MRCGAIETKLTSQANSENLILQLHMMILSAKILTKTCDQNPSVCETLRKVTCYGLLIGARHPLVLLKSQLNFRTGELSFDEMLRMEQSLSLFAFADQALYFIFQS